VVDQPLQLLIMLKMAFQVQIQQLLVKLLVVAAVEFLRQVLLVVTAAMVDVVVEEEEGLELNLVVLVIQQILVILEVAKVLVEVI
jgi:hypothetical protein